MYPDEVLLKENAMYSNSVKTPQDRIIDQYYLVFIYSLHASKLIYISIKYYILYLYMMCICVYYDTIIRFIFILLNYYNYLLIKI